MTIPATIYFDSISGNDANDGSTPALAKQAWSDSAIAAVTGSNGVTVWVRGSHTISSVTGLPAVGLSNWIVHQGYSDATGTPITSCRQSLPVLNFGSLAIPIANAYWRGVKVVGTSQDLNGFNASASEITLTSGSLTSGVLGVHSSFIRMSGSGVLNNGGSNTPGISNCYIRRSGVGSGGSAVQMYYNSSFCDNIVHVDANQHGVILGGGYFTIARNSFYCSVSSTNAAIISNSSTYINYIADNVISGFDKGIDLTSVLSIYKHISVNNNSVHGAATAFTYGSSLALQSGNETLVSSPFTDPSSEDFVPLAVGSVIAGASDGISNRGAFISIAGGSGGTSQLINGGLVRGQVL